MEKEFTGLSIKGTVLFSSLTTPDKKYPNQYTVQLGMMSDAAVASLKKSKVVLRDARTEDEDGNPYSEDFGKLVRIASTLSNQPNIVYPPEVANKQPELGKGTEVIVKGFIYQHGTNAPTFKANVIKVTKFVAAKASGEQVDEDEAL